MSKWFVYVLRNANDPPRYYTGHASDVARRHAEHNSGSCVHTSKYRPWTIDVVIEFPEESRAVAFERYLKSGSGVAFAKRHLRQSQRIPSEGSNDVGFQKRSGRDVPRSQDMVLTGRRHAAQRPPMPMQVDAMAIE